MPAGKHSSFVPPADPNLKLWRYLDVPKLLAFLASPGLHLSPLRDLQDPYEGRFPVRMRERVNQEYVQTERQCGRDPSGEVPFADVMVEHARSVIYVNCWCGHGGESEALWRIYCQPVGVALTTKYSKLAEALPDDYFIGQVKYMDYEKEVLSEDNIFNLATHKRKFFEHEHEVRVAKLIAPVDITRPLTAPKNTPAHLGLPLPFAVFDEIRVSPYALPWCVKAIAAAVRRFDCPLPVIPSDMLK